MSARNIGNRRPVHTNFRQDLKLLFNRPPSTPFNANQNLVPHRSPPLTTSITTSLMT